MVPYNSTSSLFGTMLQICFPPETYCRLQNFTQSAWIRVDNEWPVPLIRPCQFLQSFSVGHFFPHLRNKDQISVHLNAKKETMLRNSVRLFLGKRQSWVEVKSTERTPPVSSSRLKITAGRGSATPQQQASKSGCQEYPVYHQREERCQASRGLRTGSRLWQKHRQTGTRHGKHSEAQPALSSARCRPINSNQPAHHGDYFKTNEGFKSSENGFGWNLRGV